MTPDHAASRQTAPMQPERHLENPPSRGRSDRHAARRRARCRGPHPAGLDGGTSGPSPGQAHEWGDRRPAAHARPNHGGHRRTDRHAQRTGLHPRLSRKPRRDAGRVGPSRSGRAQAHLWWPRLGGLVAAPPGARGVGASGGRPRRTPRRRRGPHPRHLRWMARQTGSTNGPASSWPPGSCSVSAPARTPVGTHHPHPRNRRSAPADGAEWLLSIHDQGMDVEATHAKGDVALRGSSPDLLLACGADGHSTAWKSSVTATSPTVSWTPPSSEVSKAPPVVLSRQQRRPLHHPDQAERQRRPDTGDASCH